MLVLDYHRLMAKVPLPYEDNLLVGFLPVGQAVTAASTYGTVSQYVAVLVSVPRESIHDLRCGLKLNNGLNWNYFVCVWL